MSLAKPLLARVDGSALSGELIIGATGHIDPVYVLQMQSMSDGRPEPDVREAGWGVVAPETARGRALVSLIQPLVEWRAEQLGEPAQTLYVPVGMARSEVDEWIRRVLDGAPVAGYLLILGDCDGVSAATEDVLSVTHHVGRLVCPTDEGYAAYAEKVVRAEREPPDAYRARALLYGASGERRLVTAIEDLLKRETAGTAEEVVERPSHPDVHAFCSVTASGAPTALLTAGSTAAGSMVFGDAVLDAAALEAAGRFLPNGLWINLGSFSAGARATSVYTRWLHDEAKGGSTVAAALLGSVDAIVLDTGYCSAAAQAALAMPSGPLAILGRVDLAWEHAFLRPAELGNRLLGVFRTNRVSDYRSALLQATQEPIGAVALWLRRKRDSLGKYVNARVEEGIRDGLAEAWMLYQDLDSLVLLGDPAARLTLGERPKPTEADFFKGLGLTPA